MKRRLFRQPQDSRQTIAQLQPLSFRRRRDFARSIDIGPCRQGKRDHEYDSHSRSQLPRLKAPRTTAVPIVSHHSLLHVANQAKTDAQVNRAGGRRRTMSFSMKGRSTLSGSALDPEGFEHPSYGQEAQIRVMAAHIVAIAPGSRGGAEFAYRAGTSNAGNYRHLQRLMITMLRAHYP